eukprot:5933554-Pleurochrysis_carterae.AAC.1
MGGKRPSEKLRIIHQELTKKTAEVVGEVTKMTGAEERDADGYNRKEEKELNKEERLRESKRNQVFKWSRH